MTTTQRAQSIKYILLFLGIFLSFGINVMFVYGSVCDECLTCGACGDPMPGIDIIVEKTITPGAQNPECIDGDCGDMLAEQEKTSEAPDAMPKGEIREGGRTVGAGQVLESTQRTGRNPQTGKEIRGIEKNDIRRGVILDPKPRYGTVAEQEKGDADKETGAPHSDTKAAPPPPRVLLVLGVPPPYPPSVFYNEDNYLTYKSLKSEVEQQQYMTNMIMSYLEREGIKGVSEKTIKSILQKNWCASCFLEGHGDVHVDLKKGIIKYGNSKPASQERTDGKGEGYNMETREGGDDPIPGIDVIIEKDVSVEPIHFDGTSCADCGDEPVTLSDETSEILVKALPKIQQEGWQVKLKAVDIEKYPKGQAPEAIPVQKVEKKKLLWLIPVKVEITGEINEKGEVKNIDKPWWSFLVW